MSEPPRSIERSQLVASLIEDSFAFFSDAYTSKALTPPWPRRRFVDTQVKGPFRLWEHTPAFEERDDDTLIRDTVL